MLFLLLLYLRALLFLFRAKLAEPQPRRSTCVGTKKYLVWNQAISVEFSKTLSKVIEITKQQVVNREFMIGPVIIDTWFTRFVTIPYF